MAKFGNIDPSVITDDMMYEGEVGHLLDEELQELFNSIHQEQLWRDMVKVAKTNSALQAALDHAIMIYKLSKEYKNGI